MPACFKKIMIPVDLSINTELAIKKAVELADKNAIIHLLFVQPRSIDSWLFVKEETQWLSFLRRTEGKLKQWKNSIEEYYNDISVYIWNIERSNIQLSIEKKALELSVDLIIIGKKSYHPWFPFLNTVVSSDIVSKTGITVLTAKPGSIFQPLKNIVVPVAKEFTGEKIELLLLLSKKFSLNLHLVSCASNQRELQAMYASSMLQMYQVIKTTIRCPVAIAVLEGTNVARAVLKYANDVDADLLLLHPGTETKIGCLKKHISDILLPGSKIHVLTVRQRFL